MGIRRYTQTTFTQGEVGSFIKGRAELGIYRAGLETCENMILLPQGGIDRRRGFKFISANLESSTASEVELDPVPAITGILFLHSLTAISIIFLCSLTDNVGDSPVVPPGTIPFVPFFT